MQLLVNTPGTSLSQKDGCFQLKQGERKVVLSPERVESIVISNKAVISTQAIILAVEHHIDLLILNHYGDPVGRFWYGKMGRSVKLRKIQMLASGQPESLLFSQKWLDTKLQNQFQFLRKLQSSRPNREGLFALPLEQIQESRVLIQKVQGSVDEVRSLLMGYEGIAARAYFQCIAKVLPEAFQFDKRSRRPAQDPFNAALNYAYGILYGRVERACLLAGLDPYSGFLHADHPYRPSLVCDLIEPFRIWAETVVTYLFTGRKMKDSFFTSSNNGTKLNQEGKQVLIPAFEQHLEERIRYSQHNVLRGSLCLHEAHKLANRLLEGSFPEDSWLMKTTEF